MSGTVEPMSITATKPDLFVWDYDAENIEQVRPYFDAYMEVHARLEVASEPTADSLFVGKIPGVAGSDSEELGIAMLQRMRKLVEVAAHVARFIENGGRSLASWALDNSEMRGTLARHGWLPDGTGWAVLEDVRVTVINGQVNFKHPNKHKWSSHSGRVGQYLFDA